MGRDVLNLLLVCKDWNESLKNYVFKRYLVDESNYGFVNKNRLRIYKAICSPPFREEVYQRMVDEMPEFT